MRGIEIHSLESRAQESRLLMVISRPQEQFNYGTYPVTKTGEILETFHSD